MNSGEWPRVKQLFAAVLLVSPQEREQWLGAHCDNEAIRREVRSLLSAFEADPEFLESGNTTGVGDLLLEAMAANSERERIGPYRLVREIGRGGMGVVYEAAREDDFTQRVAIKLVLPGWSSQALVERFRYERRVLACLDHPGIARLLDGGTTEDGTPYFVMEYVDGVPVHDYCRTRNLDVHQRVELFERICAAVEHAHSNLVLHRDLKPGHILVTSSGQAKLLDFGIAKLVTEDADTAAEATRTAMQFLTPEYASPEQVSGLPVTTASDVYSLGAILYLLLAGKRPYELGGLATLEALKQICEREPPRPSSVAGEPSRRQLGGDLDNIVMKCLRKEPGERYPSVRALADDLRAWKDGWPVSASTRTLRYQAGKLLRRYRLQVVAAGVVLAALVAGGAATAWQAHVARQERDRAENRFRQVRQFSRSLLFEVHESLRKLPGATEPRQLLLTRAVGFLDGLAKDVKGDAALALELAEGYRRLGQVQGSEFSANVGDRKAAVQSFEKAAALGEEVVKARPHEPDAWILLVGVYADLTLAWLSEGDSARAQAACDRHRVVAEVLERQFPGDTQARISLASSLVNQASYRTRKKDNEGAKDFYRRATQTFSSLPPQERLLPNVVEQYARALKRLGAILIVDGSSGEAERHYRQALALEEQALTREPRNSELSYNVSFTLSDLALIARNRGDHASAEALYRRAMEIRERALAADPMNRRALHGVASARLRMGETLRREMKFTESAALLRQGLKAFQEIARLEGPAPENQIQLADVQLCLAQTLLDQADASPAKVHPQVEEARALLQAARAILNVPANAAGDPGLLPILDRQLQRAERLAK